MKRIALLLLLSPSALLAQNAALVPPAGWGDDPPALASLVTFAQSASDLHVAVTRYVEDKSAIERRYPVLYSPTRIQRLMKFCQGWQLRLRELEFERLNHEGQIDYILLRNRIDYDLETLRLAEQRAAQTASLLPFGDSIRQLQEQRLDRVRIDPRLAADTLDAIDKQATALTESLLADAKEAEGIVTRDGISPVIASRAAAQIEHLGTVLADWNMFYSGYDPIFSWWLREPFDRASTALKEYAAAINEHLVGIKPEGQPPIVGDPVLAAGLRADLAFEMIPYTPQELIAIGEREFGWVENQLEIVARDMGLGDDWKAALEHTKNLAPPPGEAPWAIFDIAKYSENYIENLRAITLPPLSREIWRLAMQTPERQLINPFFSGGEVTRLSYPEAGMTHEHKVMSMRGNTPHFNFPTVQHELVPGHHLQRFMNDRFNPHRNALQPTPFWREGWALYWELTLWDRNFARNDPDKVGMLFWRLHRAGRIVFSLNYQLGKWTPQQAVDFLVERIGHERANAEAEVRRTTIDAPLYQAAYMLGALQLRALYLELVATGRMSALTFHDAILQGGSMPIELVRARLTNQPLTRDIKSQWRFYDLPTRR